MGKDLLKQIRSLKTVGIVFPKIRKVRNRRKSNTYAKLSVTHEKTGGNAPLNKVELLESAGNMLRKWQLLIYLGQQRSCSSKQ